MYFPAFQDVSRSREITNVFGGYCHKDSCQEGQFYDMKNMTSGNFPMLSPRKSRGIIHTFTNPQGLLDKDDLWWVDDGALYKNGKRMELKNVVTGQDVTLNEPGEKVISKMGAYIIVMPDLAIINTNSGSDTFTVEYFSDGRGYVGKSTFKISLCNEQGKAIDWKGADYYKDHSPKDGDYQMTVTSDGKPSLKIYSGYTSMWMTVATTYVKISNLFLSLDDIKVGDSVKISAQNRPDILSNILVSEDNDSIYCRYFTNTYITDIGNSYLCIPGILGYTGKETSGEISVELDYLYVTRDCPDMAFVIEGYNRLWGCSKDGREIYCSALGDARNWKLYRGLSTDSWAATIGSDGPFTGAIFYGGSPIFFKEDSMIKVTVSATGAHSLKETACRGVQKGSSKSLAIINEVLYYKSKYGICAYNGSLPVSVSDDLGDDRYYDAVAGVEGNRYYVSMRDHLNRYTLFVYDTALGIWYKEDDTKALYFCTHDDDLYFIDGKNNALTTVSGILYINEGEAVLGTLPFREGIFPWYAESGAIGYSSPDSKYVARINIRLSLELGTNVDFYIQYDSSGEWIHMFNMSGSGTRSFSVPIIPRRCDHFKYRISGKGECRIYSITKTIEGGSDV